MVKVPDVMVMGRRKPPRSSHCGMEAKEVTVVVAGYDILGARLDDVELMVDVDADGVEGAPAAWWRWRTRRHSYGGSGS